jgi:hypothetical protein
MTTNTRFRRWPSRLPGQPFRLALEDPLPGVKIETAVGGGDDYLAAHHRQHCKLRSASELFPHFSRDKGLPEASLTGAVVQPPLGRPGLWAGTG